MMKSHNEEIRRAFDDQAARFEKAPVQSDPAALARLVQFADLPAEALILDVGCGPGLVAEALLNAGGRVVGVDLSAEMINRAQRRCERFGDRARFEQRSLDDPALIGPFDAVLSRYVLHHVKDPSAFVTRQVGLLRADGVLVLCDHSTDPDPARAGWHNAIEQLRDRTHTQNLSLGAIADLLIAAGLVALRLTEEPFSLDFDEWFDRGTPVAPKDEVRKRLLVGPGARGFQPYPKGDRVGVDCWSALARGVKIG